MQVIDGIEQCSLVPKAEYYSGFATDMKLKATYSWIQSVILFTAVRHVTARPIRSARGLKLKYESNLHSYIDHYVCSVTAI